MRCRHAAPDAAPFHFDGTFHKPSHLPAPLDAWEPGWYWHTLRAGGRLCGVRIRAAVTSAKPALRVALYARGRVSAGDRDAIRRELRWRFDLTADLRKFSRQARQNRRLRTVVSKWRDTRDSCAYSIYELLVVSLLLQNATVRRTVQMMQSLLEAFGTKLTFDGKTLFAIWRPAEAAAVSESDLRALKIGYRARFLKRLSADFAKRKVDEMKLRALDADAARKELMRHSMK